MEDKQYFKDRQKMSFDGWHYSVQRIDLLIVTISGAGVYAALESLKYCLLNKITYVMPIKLSGLIFVLAIVFNFASQFTGKKANRHDMLYWGDKLKGDKEGSNKEDLLADRYSNATDVLNTISIIMMGVGLSLFITYYFITF